MDSGSSLEEAVGYIYKTSLSEEEEVYNFYHWIKNRLTYKKAGMDKISSYNTPLNQPNQSNFTKEDMSPMVQGYKDVFQANQKKEFKSNNDLKGGILDNKELDNKELRSNDTEKLDISSEDLKVDSESKEKDSKAFNRHYLGLTRLLLRNPYISDDDYSKVLDVLKDLAKLFRSPRSRVRRADLLFRTAGRLKKLGHNDESSYLLKFAQDFEKDDLPGGVEDPLDQVEDAPAVRAPAPMADSAKVKAPAPEEGVGEVEVENRGNQSNISLPSTDESTPVRFEDIKAPDHDPDRYEDLAGEIGVSDAANKLDEIAGMLADRRVIRKLAEFDIMLDRLGIASMFPELAESQSKLIDSFSYALTRVTKMMGQLSQAQQVIRHTTGMPGMKDTITLEDKGKT